jgi:lipoprotein-releasing system ATP-binding protein
MLEAQNIVKSYNNLTVLKSISLKVETGSIVSIVGASGAGKSTLLHILGTLDKPDDGKLSIKGLGLTQLKGNELAAFRNKNIGFVFQFHNLLPEFTALENVCIPAYFSNNKSDKEVVKRGLELLELLGIGARKDHKPSQMSGGEQQRTAVARALVNNPSIVFADEPSGNLDSHNAEELHKLFFKLREELGQTFVIVTHNEELADMADTKLEIKDGYINGHKI